MSKYDQLDRAIMNKMGGHAQAFSAIFVRDVRQECERIAADEGREKGRSIEPFRVCDRRLQALRKARKIFHNGKGWLREQADTVQV